MRIKTNIRAGASPRCGGTMPPSTVPPYTPPARDDGNGIRPREFDNYI